MKWGVSYDRRFREAKVDQISDQYLLYVSSRNPFIHRKTAVLTKHISFSSLMRDSNTHPFDLWDKGPITELFRHTLFCWLIFLFKLGFLAIKIAVLNTVCRKNTVWPSFELPISGFGVLHVNHHTTETGAKLTFKFCKCIAEANVFVAYI